MASAEIDVKYVAHLARIALTPDEEKKIGSQLGHILGYIEKLRELDVTNVEPTAHAVPLVNVTRADEIRPSLPHEDALRNAPRQANGLVHRPENRRMNCFLTQSAKSQRETFFAPLRLCVNLAC